MKASLSDADGGNEGLRCMAPNESTSASVTATWPLGIKLLSESEPAEIDGGQTWCSDRSATGASNECAENRSALGSMISLRVACVARSAKSTQPLRPRWRSLGSFHI